MLVSHRAHATPFLVLAGGLAASALPSTRLATSLQRYRFDTARADCVGNHLEASLSIITLKQLGRTAKAYNGGGDLTPGRLNASDLLRAAAHVNDPQVPLEVVKATAVCGVLTGPSMVAPS